MTTAILCALLLTVGQSESQTPTPKTNAPSAASTEAITAAAAAAAEETAGEAPTPSTSADETPTPSTPAESAEIVPTSTPEATPSDAATAEDSYLEELRQEIAASKARYRRAQQSKGAQDPSAPGSTNARGFADRLGVTTRHGAAAAPKLTGQWRLVASVGRHEVLAENIDWFGGELRAEVSAAVERNFGDLIDLLPGIGARVGIAYTSRGREFLRLDLTEIEAGVTYQFPHEGLWDLFFPYARIDFVGGWAAVAASPDLKDDLFVPGFGTTLGVRVALPRLGNNMRLFGVAEVAYQYRVTVTPRLWAPSDLEDPLPGPPTPLGQIDLSAAVARIGVGIEL